MIALIVVAALIVLAGIAQAFGWIDLSDKTKTSTKHGGVLSLGDEVFSPTRYEAQIELDRQTILPAPAPIAGDGLRSVYNGRVQIELRAPIAR
jgi:hypothetical protein